MTHGYPLRCHLRFTASDSGGKLYPRVGGNRLYHFLLPPSPSESVLTESCARRSILAQGGSPSYHTFQIARRFTGRTSCPAPLDSRQRPKCPSPRRALRSSAC